MRIYYLCKMERKIVHPRLHAFFNSYFLNSWEAVLITSLLWFDGFKDSIIPSVFCLLSFIVFVGGVIWFWIKRPDKVLVDYRLSNQVNMFSIYFLIIILIPNLNIRWYVAPTFFTIFILAQALFSTKTKQQFRISSL